MKTRLLRAERVDLSAWSFANEGPEGQAVAQKVAEELRDRFSGDSACGFAFGATTADEFETEATDLVMTLPLGPGEDEWEGPLLVVSLEDILQEQIDELDSVEGGSATPEDLAELRDGLLELAKNLDDALKRNARKMASLYKHWAPMW